MSDIGIVAVVSHGLPELRTALRGIRDTSPPDSEIAVIGIDMGDQDATYLVRQYLRGRIQGVELDHREAHGLHCGLDRAFRLVRGDYIARIDDTFELKPGWAEKAIAALEADPGLGCLSLVPPSDYHRGRGRPRTVNVQPIEVDHLDMRCFIVRRDMVVHHECELSADQAAGCSFQAALHDGGKRLAFLPGQVALLHADEVPTEYDPWALEEELPPHDGATGALQRLKQAYQLGDDVLLTCLSCGGTELEMIAARIRFCEHHQVGVGFWYELRCPECGELLYKDDYQFRCPD
jgi:hypothetical protein